MKVSSIVMPEKAFQILRSGQKCTVEFYDNVKSTPSVDGVTGQVMPSWDYERYALDMPYRPSLAAEIESDYTTWLQRAKAAELDAESQKVRDYRDALLDQCDTQYCNAELWGSMSEGLRTAWMQYKQALRDIPGQDGFPYLIDWPIAPSEKLEE